MTAPYLFTSDRLGFRAWTATDLAFMTRMNADLAVMRHFPSALTPDQSLTFLQAMVRHQAEKGYSYFATERLEDKALIGFIGLKEQTYLSEINPMVDIGWRLVPEYWRKGYATEGARRCLQFAFASLGLTNVYSVAAKSNLPSIGVMQKIGMTFVKEFVHPAMEEDSPLQPCVLYIKQA